MPKNKVGRAIIYYVLVAIGVTIIWNIALRAFILPRFFIKTEATVIEIVRSGAGSARGSLPTNYPIYTYIDDRGEQRTYYWPHDGFNNINGLLFKKEVGKSYVAYYEKGSKEGLFITGTGDWLTFMLAPLVLAIFPFGLLFALWLYMKYRSA